MSNASQTILSAGQAADDTAISAQNFINDRKSLRRLLGCAAVFAAFYLLFSLSTMLINARVAFAYGSERVSLYYALGLVTTAAGFVAFGLCFRFHKMRRAALLLDGAIYAASLLCALFTSIPGIISVSALVCPFAYGYLGGAVHYRTAERLRESDYKGRLIGMGFCLTVFVQFFIQGSTLSDSGYAALLLSVLVLVLWQILLDANLCSLPRKANTLEKTKDSELWAIVAIVVAVALMTGVYDGMAAQLHASHAVNLTGWTRLMVGVGAALSGFLFDMKRRTQINVIILCAALVDTVAILLLSMAQSFLLSHLLFTFGTGFYIVYAFVSFMEAAPQSGMPQLWAGAGRVTHSLAMSVTTALAGVFSAMQPAALNAVTAALFLATLLLFVFSGRLSLPSKDVNNRDTLSDEERIRLFSLQYRLTPRETEVFERLLSDADTNADIASELAISVRVFQRYVASIYEKAGVQSRVSLIKLYYNNN